ncbi:hypothetical protein EON77_16140, partial [bacterium]
LSSTDPRGAGRTLTELRECGVLSVDARGNLVRGQCFVAGTAVATPTGSRTIEQIEPGDYVLAAEREAGDEPPPRREANETAGPGPKPSSAWLDSASYTSEPLPASSARR